MEKETKKKVGIGVGVVLGLLVIGLVLWWMLRKPKEGAAGGTRLEGAAGDGGTGGTRVGDKAKGALDSLLGKIKDWIPPPDDTSGPPPSGGTGLSGPDPYAPTTSPQTGKYYAVKKGDSDASIVIAAGFPQALRTKARRTMREHQRNEWIGTYEDPQANYGFRKQLRLFQRFAPTPGFEGKTWTWNTSWEAHSGSPNKWPVVYVPTMNEVEG